MRVFIAVRFTDEIKSALTGAMAELCRQGVRGACYKGAEETRKSSKK